jgi:hypothetical protein
MLSERGRDSEGVPAPAPAPVPRPAKPTSSRTRCATEGASIVWGCAYSDTPVPMLYCGACVAVPVLYEL